MEKDENSGSNGLKLGLTKLIEKIKYFKTKLNNHEFSKHEQAKFYVVSLSLTISINVLLVIVTTNLMMIAYATILLYLFIIVYFMYIIYNKRIYIISILKKFVKKFTATRCKYCVKVLEADIIHIRKDLRMSNQCLIIDRENFDLEGFIEEAINYYKHKTNIENNTNKSVIINANTHTSIDDAFNTDIKSKQGNIITEYLNVDTFNNIVDGLIVSNNKDNITNTIYHNYPLLPGYKEPLSLPPANIDNHRIANLIRKIEPSKNYAINTQNDQSMISLSVDYLELIKRFSKDPQYFSQIIPANSDIFKIFVKLVEMSLDNPILKVSKSDFKLIHDIYFQCLNKGLMDTQINGFYPIRDPLIRELLRDYWFNSFKYQQLDDNQKNILNNFSKKYYENPNTLINSLEKDLLYDIKKKCEDLNLL